MSLSDIIYNMREETIAANYNAAISQVKELVGNNPFQTTFTVTAGCVSQEMTREIAKRFNVGGIVKAIVQQGGVVSCSHSILLTCPLNSIYEDK
jgi:hypothetical protein